MLLMNLFSELKRRNVFRVGAAYLVVAWLLIQIADTLSDMLALPDVIGRTILLLLAIGFPVALILSWIYETTPQGLVTQESVDAGTPRSTGRKLNAVIISGMALAIVFLVVDDYLLDTPAAVPVPPEAASTDVGTDAPLATAALEKSIAVLPFANLSSDPEQEYFSDGLSEEILNKLAQVPDLLVIARTSSFYFKGRNEDMRTIGEQLGANFILEGSVRKADEQLRINAQLIRADTGTQLWSQAFDRSMDDVFAIQDEIALQVTTNLSISLGVGDFDRPGMTRNVAAYDAYLKGRKVFDEVGLAPEQAVAHFRQAVALDPEFAYGWSSLAGAYRLDGMNSPVNEAADLSLLEQEARARALSLIPELPETRAIAARQAAIMNRDWIGADRTLKSLVDEFGSSNPTVNRQYGIVLMHAGKPGEALPYLQRAARLDPIGGGGQTLALVYLQLGREEEALAEVDRTLARGIAIDFQFLHAVRTMAAYNDDTLDRAIATLKMNTPGQPEFDIGLPIAELLAAGNRDEAVRRLREVLQSDASRITRAILQPMAALTGNTELALDYTRLVTEDPAGQLGVWMPYSRRYFNEPAMKQRLRDAGLVDYWKATGWGDFCKPIAGTENDFECF